MHDERGFHRLIQIEHAWEDARGFDVELLSDELNRVLTLMIRSNVEDGAKRLGLQNSLSIIKK